MLSQQTIDIVKSTVPALEAHGKEITTKFYEKLFENHPELLNVFNHANQKKGRQQTALANTVLAAAKHIDELEVLLPAVKQIGSKHRSLAVKPEHYPIVGENLLAAIKDVLGDAATDEILNAWAEAYGEIANVFIGIEKEMYKEAETQQGGWKDFASFTVKRKEKESSMVTSFYFVRTDEKELPTFKPGQYISVRVKPEGEEYTMIRQYSLSDAPGQNHYRISVKREASTPEGKVSNYLHDFVKEGDIVEITAPAGDFVLDSEKTSPVTLIGGGVGVTPLMSMLKTIASQQPNRDTTFIQAAESAEVQAFKDEIQQTVEAMESARSFTFLSSGPVQEDKRIRLGRIDENALKAILYPVEGDFYICGPAPFMRAMSDHLKALGAKEEQIHYEFFGPALPLGDVQPL
ncbi:NO-inducible flavohemoprotein [Metabacillus sp. GX 13764]|uniref:NO-inducible flavohemoprotein n=1 Tax=Metabacillus kandeliae TaxID=2900151 RepID=UPI001E480F3F|nr:NO-inducible flavohemoprotein [Metabacillus kandeliae]MCD7035231.1 NO-inducible flavohemoprotein [Metabacillus kandeliae]